VAEKVAIGELNSSFAIVRPPDTMQKIMNPWDSADTTIATGQESLTNLTMLLLLFDHAWKRPPCMDWVYFLSFLLPIYVAFGIIESHKE
ncbi:hypothetical protein Tco_0029717, partial [Tanacetum coccineum]